MTDFLDAITAVANGQPIPAAESAAPDPAPEKPVETKTAASETNTPEPAARETKQPKATAPTIKEPPAGAKGLDALAEDEADGADNKDPEPEEDLLKDAPETARATPEATNAWTGIKKEAKELKMKLAAVEAERDQFRAAAEKGSKLQDADPLKKELEAAKAQVAAFEKEAAVWRIESTTAYKSAVTAPLAKVEEDMLALAKRTDIDPEKLADAIAERNVKKQDAALDELADGLTEREKTRLFSLAEETAKIFTIRDRLESNAPAALKEAQAKEAEAKEAAKNETRAAQMREVDETVKTLAKKSIAKFLVADGETQEQAIEAISKAAQETPWDEMDPKQQAFAVASAVSLMRLQKTLLNQQARIRELEAAVGDDAAATPKAGRPEGKAAKPRGTDFVDSILDSFGVK